MNSTTPEITTSLSELLNSNDTNPPLRTNFNTVRLKSIALKIEELWPDWDTERDSDYNVILDEIKYRIVSDNWSECRLRLICEGIRAAFDIKFRSRGDLTQVRNFYFAEIYITTKKSLLNAAVKTYIETFEPFANHTERLGNALKSNLERFSPIICKVLKHLPNFFEPRQIVRDLVLKMISAERPYQHLIDLGLRSPHGQGLMDYVHKEFIERISPKLNEDSTCNKLLDWLKPSGKPARQQGAVEAIDAIISPWLRNDPDIERQSIITRRLVEMYGDPRKNSGYPWFKIKTEHRYVFMRWLTGENLRLLFDAISETNDNHMWTDRREFYLGLHKQNRIDAVWIAFAEAGYKEAKSILKGENHGFEFGKQVARGYRKNTSLLILKIGSKIVVDGSHSYKVHIFRETDPRAPKLFLPEYNCESIRLSADSDNKLCTSHHPSWRTWVEMRI